MVRMGGGLNQRLFYKRLEKLPCQILKDEGVGEQPMEVLVEKGEGGRRGRGRLGGGGRKNVLSVFLKWGG